MGTDTLTPVDSWTVLRAVLETITPGTYFTSDDWHAEADAAQLKSAEKGAAHDRAVELGWAERVVVDVGGRTAAVQVPSRVPSRKGGAVQLLRRLDVGVPVMAGQGSLWEGA